MSYQDLATDLASGLEVKPQPAGAIDDGASPSGDAGDPSSDDRKVLNRVAELQKNVRSEMDSLRGDMSRVLAIAEAAIRNGVGAQPAPEVKPPHTRESIEALADAGDIHGLSKALLEMQEFNRAQDRVTIRTEVQQDAERQAQATQLKARMVTKLGLMGPDNSATREIERRAKELVQDFPAMDLMTARVWAGNEYWREVANGETELPEDLREEHNRRTGGGGGGLGDDPRSAPPKLRVDHSAPNRGLPDFIVEKIRKHGLEEILEVSSDRRVETIRRESVQELLDEETAIARRRKAQGYR